MKKLLMILIMVGMALGLSGVTLAAVPYTLDSRLYAGPDYNSGWSMLFTPNTYTFSVFDAVGDDGWRDDAGDTGNFQWSLYIYQPSDTANYPNGQLLGSTNLYSSMNAAYSNNSASMVDITVSNPSGETLTFWMLDTDSGYCGSPTCNNDGSVTFQVAVVPEPISSILFLTGGVVLVGRKYLKKRKA
ncbi:MAG: hypothetical protein JSV11_05735 [Nitrospiraceae bacterium]|nr:MAG: hypothetical protein JSU99_07965 [Nitrospiraceae bacterium]UCH46199.1 MAG: hypothetical protein JSV11_05735 [Nitrospiraceae bacterium]